MVLYALSFSTFLQNDNDMGYGIRDQLAGVVSATGEIDARLTFAPLVLKKTESVCEVRELVGFDVVCHLSSLSNIR